MFTQEALNQIADAVVTKVFAKLQNKPLGATNKQYLTYAEVGEMIGRSKNGVRYLVKQGKLPICDECGRVPRIHIDDVRRYMDGIKHWV